MPTDTSPTSAPLGPIEPSGVPQPGTRDTQGQLRTRFDAIVDYCAKIVAWLVLIAMAISVVEVISRYVFDSPTSWVHEMVIFMIAVLFALGGAAAMARDRHIRVRLIYGMVSPKWRRRLDVLNGILTLGFTLGMSYAAYTMFYRSVADPLGGWTLERSGTSWNPPFPSLTKGIILFALAVMAVQSVLHLVHAVRSRPDEGKPEAARGSN
ncbi:MAG: TRAP transporter small permease [Rhodospirillales bacterium]|jgi:TRAP-type C4-dicarboxylate transport system permease small subunit|nr:TRAP transporter small permease [Rhodospirillales bacterium]